MQKRPAWVWVISIFIFLSAAYTLFSFYLIFSGTIPLDSAQQSYFASVGLLGLLDSLAIGIVNLAAAITLFMLRKISVNLFIIAFVLNILSTLMQAFTTNWIQVLGGAGSVGALIGLVIPILIILYARNLAKKGILH